MGDKKLPAFVATENLAYQATYEITRGSYSEEIREIFDSDNQRAVAVQLLTGSRVKTYSDYKKNELTAIFGYGTDNAMCQVLNLKANIDLTPFEIKELDNNITIAVSPISSMFHKQDIIQVSWHFFKP